MSETPRSPGGHSTSAHQDRQTFNDRRGGQEPAEVRLKPLIDGYRRFRTTEWPRERERFELTATHGQQPHSLVIACSDSRVDPQMILGARPGELFVVRNVTNLVPPHEHDEAHHGTSAAIEFAVRVLDVGRILVLGHGMCGGVKMLLDDPPPVGFDFATRWMDLAKDAKSMTADCDTPEDRHKACEEATVRLSLENLLTFPWVVEGVSASRLSIHGGYFDIRHGTLYILQPDGQFAAARDEGERPAT
ncbi:MAG: carbonic anhydrase [Phenylobacterium sp.]|uniref:carbonic anhydrase n=1 Tax=Phenylobacterium sp. TaxID=1871053 RepID=UPI002733B32E|nr:carbonic anhydrase [Phenylobacterium sp.]MDP3173336.1 carbonic anhydrase [Phenylobacterium sp.]